MANDVWTAPAGPVAGVASLAEMQAQRTDNLYVAELVMEGDQSASGKVHQHKSGTLANRPAAGNAGRFYFATDLGVTFIDDGAVWHVFSHIPAICDRLYEDFHLCHAGTVTATGYFAGWRVVIGGAGGQASMPNAGHSFIEIKGTTAAGGFCNLTPKGSGIQYIESVGAVNYPLVFESAVQIVGGNYSDYHFGIMYSPSLAASPSPSSSIMFRVEDLGNVVTVTQDKGGGETTNDMGATPTGTDIDLFRIEVFSASSVVFTFWKGGLGGTKYTETHVAGIPSMEKLLPAFSARTSTAADRELYIDSCDLLYKRDY